MKACPYCHATKLYTKSHTQMRCATCKRTFSLHQWEKEQAIIHAFVANQSARACAFDLGLHYEGVMKRYQSLRLLLAHEAEQRMQESQSSFIEYDEYLYRPKSAHKEGLWHEGVAILGMDYGAWITTLLLPKPPLMITYHNQRIRHALQFENRLAQFWHFFEGWIAHFKGVTPAQLIYYLKEAEFKFNTPSALQEEKLIALWNAHRYM